MKIGYQDPYEHYDFDDGIYIKNNILHIISINDFDMNDFLDLERVINSLEIDVELEGINIYGNQEQIIHAEIFTKFQKIKSIFIRNVEINNLNWLEDMNNLEYLTITSTMGFGMQPEIYHPIKHLTSLKHLNVSFSSFSDDSVYISKEQSIFDDLNFLEYLNLRETNIKNTSFLSLIKSNDILINFTDNNVRLDFNKHDNIRLVTILTGFSNGTLMDISRYVGNY